MKLISNFKDYYDFCIGKYGIDSKCVYNRISEVHYRNNEWIKKGVFHPCFNAYNSFTIYFCGTVYYGHYYNGKIYYGLDAEEIPTKIKINKPVFPFEEIVNRGTVSNHLIKGYNGYINDINTEYNKPVLVLFNYDLINNPVLSDFQFGKVVSPEEAFIKISNFLMQEPIIENKMSDKEKVLSHGFDLKSSFRNIK